MSLRQNDRMALGALQSIKKHKVKGIKIVGIDALPVPGGGMENVRDGNLEASYIYPYPRRFGYATRVEYP